MENDIKKILKNGNFTHKTIKNIIQKRTIYGINEALNTLEAFSSYYVDGRTITLKIYESRRLKSNNQCPHCGQPMSIFCKQVDKYKWKCTAEGCKKYIYPLSGTPLEGAHKDLDKILVFVYYFFNSKHGLSAKEVQRLMGWRYKTAHHWCRRIRQWMGLAVDAFEFDKNDCIEGDEVFIRVPANLGRFVKYTRGLGSERIVSVVTQYSRKTGYAKAYVVDDVDKATIRDIYKNVSSSSTICTDGKPVYKFLSKEGYNHSECNHKKKIWSTEEGTHTNHLEALHSFIKSTIGAVHRGVSREYLSEYLSQSCFVFSLRDKNAIAAAETLFEALPPFHKTEEIIINEEN